MKSQWVEYSHGDTKLKAYMAYDDRITGRRPAVLVAHARSGMSPQTLKLTEIWAKLGYVSFAADIFGYGQGVLPKNVEEMVAQTEIYSKDRELMKARTQAGYVALLKSPMVDPAKAAAPYMHPRLANTDAAIAIGSLTGDLAAQGRTVLEALSGGELSPNQAATVMQAISAQARIVEVDELEQRIAALEGKSK
ncbi:MAG: hypothetical protein EHM61_21520 [Acidobacteria bacterium]|nr:MAG: hypothetical protein EHM61_21520 [Acidobacteriota bacterium]